MTYTLMDYAGTKYGFPFKIDGDDEDFDEEFSGIEFATYEITNNERKLVAHRAIISKSGMPFDELAQKIINDDKVDVFSLNSKIKGKDGYTHYYVHYYVSYFSEEEENY